MSSPPSAVKYSQNKRRYVTLVHCLHGQEPGGSKVTGKAAAPGFRLSATAAAADMLAFALIKRCNLLIVASGVALTFRLILCPSKSRRRHRQRLAVASNYWCHPESQLTWLAGSLTCCRVNGIVRTHCWTAGNKSRWARALRRCREEGWVKRRASWVEC